MDCELDPVFSADPMDYEQYRNSVGLLFGKDVNQWRPLGNDRVDVLEEDGMRTTKRTGVYSTVELEWVYKQHLYDERLEDDSEIHPRLNFGLKESTLDVKENWMRFIRSIPCTASTRRATVVALIKAKCKTMDLELHKEAMQALWELSINRRHHKEIDNETLVSLDKSLRSENATVKKLAAAVVWGLATVSENRKCILAHGIVSSLQEVITSFSSTDSTQIQEFALGALSVLLTDRCCRMQFLESKTSLTTLLSLCQDQGSSTIQEQRTLSAKLLMSIVQRDHEVRLRLIQDGGLKIILELLHEQSTETKLLQFYMAMCLSSLVLDDKAMESMQQRNECYTLFRCCLTLLKRILGELREADVISSKDGQFPVRIAEGCAQALWGSSYYCALSETEIVTKEEITDLAFLVKQSAETTKVLLNSITHCLTASLATFCSNEHYAKSMVQQEAPPTIHTLLFLLKCEADGYPSIDGHTIAAACTGVAFLACHPIGAKGEKCMIGKLIKNSCFVLTVPAGPYRSILLENGAYSILLNALIHPPENKDCRAIVEESAAIAVMYLSTMAGKLEESSLESLSILLKRSQNVEMLEYLMTGMWILLRNPENRCGLVHAFDNGDRFASSKAENKISDAIQMHEITEEKLERNISNACLASHPSESPRNELENQLESIKRDEWGLETLVQVGERWLAALKDFKDTKNTNAAILKLFEFLTASLCLFLIPDDNIPDFTPKQLYKYNSKRPSRNLWWTVSLKLKSMEASEVVDEEQITEILNRTLVLLSSLLSLNYRPAWKVMQLACVTLWNICSRSIPAEEFLAKSGICTHLLNITWSEKWPTSLRNCAAGFLQNFNEKFKHQKLLDSEVLFKAIVNLMNTEIPLLELTSAYCIARCAYHVPEGCSTAKEYLKECKRIAAGCRAIESSFALLRRLNKRLQYFLTGSGEEPLNVENDEDDSCQYQREMNNIEAVLETHEAVLTALLNLSVLSSNQDLIGRHGLVTLFETNSIICEKLDQLGSSGRHIMQLSSAVLHNASLHISNRTRMYKAELSGSLMTRKIQHSNKQKDLNLNKRPKLQFSSVRTQAPLVAVSPQQDNRASIEDSQEDDNISSQFLKWMSSTSELTEAPRESIWLRLSATKEPSRVVDRTDHSLTWDGALNKTLCRPLNHSWQIPQFLRTGSWNPEISEYREVQNKLELSSSIKKLLSTKGQPQENYSEDVTTSFERPSTTKRQSGKTPVMVFQSSGGTDASHNTTFNVRASSIQQLYFVCFQIVISPQRLRTIISFSQRLSLPPIGNTTQPHLTMFEHVVGSRVSKGLFPAYSLPSGKSVFYYYSDGSVINEKAIEKLVTPERPNSIPAALQQGMPLTRVLDVIAKPPGSGVAIAPYRAVPRLVPLPTKHTLPVKYPESNDAETFGDLREDNLYLILKSKEIQQTRTTTSVQQIERVEANKEPWTLPNSIFKPRLRESDSRDFFDTSKVLQTSFERDWKRCCKKEKFTSMISREAKGMGHGGQGLDENQIIEDLRKVLKDNYWSLCSAFLYYAATGNGDPFHLSLNSYTSFLDEASIVDASTKRSDCDTIFIISNFVPDKKAPEHVVNNEQALMRFEFVEAIVRIGILRYYKNGEAGDLASAIELLFENNIKRSLSAEMFVHSNIFRKNRLYVEEVDLLFKRHSNLLRAVYSRYRTKPAGGGLRHKVVKLDGWLQLMEDTCLIDADFTLLDAQLCYLRSRMWVQDEIKDYAKYESLSFVDFLEALARSADLKLLPTRFELEASGYRDISKWMRDSSNEGILAKQDGRHGNSFTPLYTKLEIFLDLVFRMLHYDPSETKSEFSHETLLKMIKKKDKELGP
eukprot:g582.t1